MVFGIFCQCVSCSFAGLAAVTYFAVDAQIVQYLTINSPLTSWSSYRELGHSALTNGNKTNKNRLETRSVLNWLTLVFLPLVPKGNNSALLGLTLH